MTVKNKYDYNIETETVVEYLILMKNNIYKLLPLREENRQWRQYLESLLELELTGCETLFTDISFVSLITKLCSLQNKNFYMYRKGIFESLGIIDSMINKLQKGEDENEQVSP